jgi:Holliday junction resolvase-like predicted endonuclease
LDLVVCKGARLRFVEVKARSTDDPVGIEAIGSGKRAHLIRAARAWLRQHEPDVDEMAFTVALVEDEAITWYDDAFDVE